MRQPDSRSSELPSAAAPSLPLPIPEIDAGLGGTVLVVEDSRFFVRLLQQALCARGFEVVIARDLAQATREAAGDPDRFLVALVDLHLPDAANCEAVDAVMGCGIPVIVFTGEFSAALRDKVMAKKVVDYVIKEASSSLDRLVHVVQRVARNRLTRILLVDDSRAARAHVGALLRTQQYLVEEAADGQDALAKLERYDDIKLVLTDYNMPKMDGFELTKAIRAMRNRQEIAIIGMSSQENKMLSVHFMKSGASDYVHKPFMEEELFCRINQNVEMLEQIQALAQASNRDFLTGLNNRRYFYDAGARLFAAARRSTFTLAVGMIDIDFFKKVNDTYGHDAGDLVLREVARVLRGITRAGDVLARLGGEEFCLLVVNAEAAHLHELFERFRSAVEDTEIDLGRAKIRVTVSIGVSGAGGENLQGLITQADGALYAAKQDGRNRVVVAA